MKRGQDFIGVYVGTFVYDGDGNYLVGWRTKNCRDEHERWDMVGGGGVEFGETLEEAVKREVKEEIGADVISLSYLGHKETFREHEGKSTHWVGFYYKVLVDPKTVKNMEPDMCGELLWCTLDSIPHPRHSHMDSNLEKYKNKL